MFRNAGTSPGQETGRLKSHRSGLADVARLASVGIATVDRVLNERGGVAAGTARRVIEAARQLNLRRALPTPYTRRVRLEVLLARSETPFFARLTQAFIQVAATLDRSVVVMRSTLDQSNPRAIAQRIRATNADGLIVYCEDHPVLLQAIVSVVRAGIPVICLVTDVPASPRLAYVGIDHTKAGRTAGFFVSRVAQRSGSALVLTTSLGYQAHRERLAGFQESLQAYAPEFRIAEVLQGHDDRDRAYHLVAQSLRRDPDIVAIYNTGGVNRAVAAAIRDISEAGKIVFVGHELTESSAALLREGIMTLTIDQAPELQARRAIEVMLNHLGFLERDPYSTEIPFTLHTRENTWQLEWHHKVLRSKLILGA
jgi:LacI family transcriptional regulator